jgi:adenylate cyclase
MPRNIEIKARVTDRDELERRVRALADQGPIDLVQDDTFFPCPRGRLKLRELAPDRGELIFYERPDETGPKLSDYLLAPTDSPTTLRDALSRALGVCGRVRKTRRLYLAGATRLHLDEVEGLGAFLELEVVLAPDQSAAAGEAIAADLLARLDIAPADLVRGAYLDLLRDAQDVAAIDQVP